MVILQSLAFIRIPFLGWVRKSNHINGTVTEEYKTGAMKGLLPAKNAMLAGKENHTNLLFEANST